MMQLIPGAHALVVTSDGVYSEIPLHFRDNRLYVPVRGGYALIGARYGERWHTSHCKLQVCELMNLRYTADKTGVPHYHETPRVGAEP